MNKKRIRVLLIDDNSDEVRLIQEILKEDDTVKFELEHASQFLVGLEYLKEKRFDVLLLDLNVPDNGGLHKLSQVRTQSPKLPIVVLTGFIDEVIGAKVVQAGAQDYLIKEEVNSKLLVRSIRYAIERKRVEEELRAVNESLECRVAERTSALAKTNTELRMKVAKHKEMEEEIKLLQTMTFAIVEAEDFSSTLGIVLHKVCEATGWVYGEAWLISPEGKYLEYCVAWHRDPKKKEAIKRDSKMLTFSPDCGLPGRVWSLKKPEWMIESMVRRNFPHAEFCKKFGFKAAMGIPVVTNDEVIAVLTFFMQEQRDEDERLIRLISSVATQLSVVIHRKMVEDALRISEGKYRLLLENLPQRIFYKDKSLVYVSCNRNLAADFHIRPDEVTGKTDYDFFPGELAGKYRAEDKQIMESGQTDEREEEYSKDGQELIIRIVRTPIKDEKGAVIGILGIFWDITEKVILQREAERSRHLASLGELAASVGHEINNPITGVINCAQILLNKSSEGSKEKDLARRIIKEGDRIANIVHSLLSFTQPDSEKKNIINMHGILSDTLTLIESQLRKEGITMKLDISQKLPEILAHPQQIQQVFLSIINNARYALNQKYPETHDNKIFEISGEEITMNNTAYVKIIFYDHGAGIPAEMRDKVINPFFTTKYSNKGIGLGLSISHTIIRNHGGKLMIDSREGEYTKIIIMLPRYSS
ncbi:MAG: diguanylate cyclase/phosphodiesterase (GGDEF & EAL domains) with PAS/PAC sensor(s) [Candidatus Jettenia ecosi]|uniref:histidine kinase n=1 Tax=Candidatus Jettenia ecosi TaxID=2494326 RepID=A0A533Q6Z1_9BACT|nr:MAG: diguanylate cyclase/phosphodiesterase (GGDEF & EAL domains) with PAS/PAC sensor(s) [Candidatus Jettenia ecosi]